MSLTNKNNQVGFFIVLEGPDGSGKTTQWNLLGERLTALGYDVVLGREPTQGPIGQKIRSFLALKEKNPVRKDELQRLYLEDRKDDIQNTIAPRLAENKILVWDRYQTSTEVYFVAEGGDWETIGQLRDTVLGDAWISPDLEIIFRVDPEECMRRLIQTGKRQDYFETREFLDKLCAGYETYLQKHPEAAGVDAMQNIERVARNIETAVLKRLGEWRSS